MVVSGRDAARGEQVVSAITSGGGKARFVQADLADRDSVLRLAGEAGEIDILISNAGGSPLGGTADMTPVAVYDVFNVNVIGPFLSTGNSSERSLTRSGAKPCGRRDG